MSRRSVSSVERLLTEAQSIEALLSDIVPQAELVEEYWQISLLLIDLVRRIEEAAGQARDESDEAYPGLRSELSQIESRITQLERAAEA